MSEAKSTEGCLFILMRSDITSLNPGKAMAQACHAGSALARRMDALFDEGPKGADEIQLLNLYEAWKHDTSQGFGTCVVLDGVDAYTIHDEVHLTALQNAVAEVIHDPTYPVTDGNVTHLIPLDTCAYIFTDRLGEYGRDLSNRFLRHP